MFWRSTELGYCPMSTLLHLGLTDGLVDCMDPDCCSQSSCQGQPYCHGSPDPISIVSQGQGSSSTQSAPRGFYERISFLVGHGGSHVIPGDNPFNSRWASSNPTVLWGIEMIANIGCQYCIIEIHWADWIVLSWSCPCRNNCGVAILGTLTWWVRGGTFFIELQIEQPDFMYQTLCETL